MVPGSGLLPFLGCPLPSGCFGLSVESILSIQSPHGDSKKKVEDAVSRTARCSEGEEGMSEPQAQFLSSPRLPRTAFDNSGTGALQPIYETILPRPRVTLVKSRPARRRRRILVLAARARV